MRKSVFITTFILTIIISCSSIFGQKNRTRDAEYFPIHEFYVQYGAPTIFELTSTLQPALVSRGAEELEIIAKDVVFSGVGGLGYNLSISELVSVGIYGGISLASANIYTSINDKETPQYSSQIVSYTGQFSIHWKYYQEGALEISSGAYAGLNYIEDTVKPLVKNPTQDAPKAKPFIFAYHLTALKVRYGDMIGGFAELGFGYRGLVNVGLSVKL